MREVFRLIDRAGPTDKAILIQGASGTGKELVARALHRASKRLDKPFVAINCAALPESLLESELFGHEKGAFTGAIATKLGLFEVADGGTLFIDEIGEMPGALQAKLLRVLEDGSMRRVGSLEGNTRRRPSAGRHESESAARSAGRPVPRRSFLSDQRPQPGTAAAGRAVRRRPLAGRAVPRRRLERSATRPWPHSNDTIGQETSAN